MIAGLRVRIDRTLCVAFEDCVGVAPTVFRMDEDGIVTFIDGAADVTRERLFAACEECPVDALSLFEATGERLVG